MNNILLLTALAVGIYAFFKVADVVKYTILYKQKPQTTTVAKWSLATAVCAFIVKQPSLMSIVYLSFLLVMLTLTRMIYLTRLLTK